MRRGSGQEGKEEKGHEDGDRKVIHIGIYVTAWMNKITLKGRGRSGERAWGFSLGRRKRHVARLEVTGVLQDETSYT